MARIQKKVTHWTRSEKALRRKWIAVEVKHRLSQAKACKKYRLSRATVYRAVKEAFGYRLSIAERPQLKTPCSLSDKAKVFQPAKADDLKALAALVTEQNGRLLKHLGAIGRRMAFPVIDESSKGSVRVDAPETE